jgi:hypothetical protein
VLAIIPRGTLLLFISSKGKFAFALFTTNISNHHFFPSKRITFPTVKVSGDISLMDKLNSWLMLSPKNRRNHEAVYVHRENQSKLLECLVSNTAATALNPLKVKRTPFPQEVN